MRRLAAILLVASSAGASDTLDFNRSDHKIHAAMGGAIALGSAAVYDDAGAQFPATLGILTSLGIGLLKEMSDPVFSESDMQADALGAVGGALFFSISF